MNTSQSCGDSCECEICKFQKPFTIPDDLIKNFFDRNVVIFAGAGISSENRNVFPLTFYESICNNLSIDPDNGLSFPDLMSKLCSRPNGRSQLLQKIKKRIDYIKSFPELYWRATRFHSELSSIYLVDSIITTNWDDFFERECGAMPITGIEDFAFWDMPDRKVFKIHGSINSYGSIIATREDYEKCYDRLSTGLLGSSLKMMLATKTIIYIGFSFKDDDFIRIHQILSKEMGEIRPSSYIVTLDEGSDDRFRELGLNPVYTDGVYFLHKIKQELFTQKIMLNDNFYIKVESLLEEITSLHIQLTKKINIVEQPDSIYLYSYQDGVIHALERMMSLQKTGYYSNPDIFKSIVYSYRLLRKEATREKRYHDVAYIDGYIEGHTSSIFDDVKLKRSIFYYIYGYSEPIFDFDQYQEIIKNTSNLHKSAHKFAERIVNEKKSNSDITIHHRPFL